MGKCILCGKSAGLLRDLHDECKIRNAQGRDSIRSLIAGLCLSSHTDIEQIDRQIAGIAESSHVTSSALHREILAAWEDAVRMLSHDRDYTQDQIACLEMIREHYRLYGGALSDRAMFLRFVHLSALLKIRNDEDYELPHSAELPFALREGERLLWVFENVELVQKRFRENLQQTATLQRMLSSAMDKPVQKKPVEDASLDNGALFVTDQKMHFKGGLIRQTITLADVQSLAPATGGVAVQQHSANASFELHSRDSWLIYQILNQQIR